MRQDWDDRARKNAFRYIASWREEWDLDSFLASGEEDFNRLVVPVLARCSLPVTGQSMLELGCGTGRMTHSFARRFACVCAIDISPEMLARACQIHAERKNIRWLLGNGFDLSCVDTDSMDLVFSYLVLQHLPDESLVFRYVSEMLRVLRPGGAILFQFNGRFAPAMNWRGRLAWGTVDALWSCNLRALSHAMAFVLGLDPIAAGKSWRGAAITASRIAEQVLARGGEVREMFGENTPMAWCCGVKTTRPA
jgi:SAM-dependent methyltransferase